MNDARGHALRGLVLRFTVWAAVLAGLLVAWGAQVERAVLPWLGTVLRTIDADHRIEHLGLLDTQAGRVIQLTVTRQRYVVVGDRALEPNVSATAEASTLAGGLRLTLVLVFASALAHKSSGWPARGVQLLLASVAALFGLALDVPLLLAAEIRGLYLRAYAPQAWSALRAWSDFMIDGGRQFVPLALGCLVGALAGAVRHRPPPVSRA